MAKSKVQYDGTDRMPAFLIRPKGKPVDLKQMGLSGGGRSWAPMRKAADIPKPAAAPVFVDNRNLPVVVNVRQKTGAPVLLGRYNNMDEFDAGHDHKCYPVARTATYEGETIVLVTAKPWAKVNLGVDLSGPTPPTAAQEKRERRQASTSNLTANILKACAKGANRAQVIAALVAENFDKQMLDNRMYGTLERMVKAGQLRKDEGKLYWPVG